MLLLALGAAPEGECAGELEPFTATYAVEWHGITAGYSTLALKQTGPGTYTYSSHIRARGLFRIAFPDVMTQVSTFRLSDGEVQPLNYHEDDGSGDKKQDVSLDFDWETHRVHGVNGTKLVDKPIEPGTQDPFSVQIALMRDLAAGHPPTSFVLFDKDEAKQYQYTRERTETLETPLGRLETVVYRSDRPGNDRVTRLWLAQSLGYLPVQAERRRGDRVDFSLRVREMKRGDNAAPASADNRGGD
jgi:hypothetical protein